MIKIAICDDSSIERTMLKNMITALLNEMGHEVFIAEFSSGEQLKRNFAKGDWNLIFLDIRMKQLDGIQTGEAIRKKDAKVEIVYETSSEEFFREGLVNIHAMGYILKPYDIEPIRECLVYYLNKYDIEPTGLNNYLAVTVQQKSIMLPQKDIFYLESSGRVVTISCGRRAYRVYSKLSDIEERLNMSNFLRCNRSYIINMMHVKEVLEFDFLMEDDHLIPIRKRDRKEILQKYYYYQSILGG